MISDRDKQTLEESMQDLNQNKFVFIITFLKNWFLERLASSFPIPSWRVQFHRMRGIKIGKNVYIGYDVIFDRIYPQFITIEDYAEIGDRCFIAAHTRGSLLLRNMYSREVKPVKIGRGAWIAPYVKILPGITIGERAVVGIGSVVGSDIPPESVAVGFPARVIKKVDID